MPNIPCFVIVPAPRVKRSLRRFSDTSQCSSNGYHDASRYFETVDSPADTSEVITDSHDHSDPLWPGKCAHCDYMFTDNDHWQVFEERIYMRATDPDVTCTLRNAPLGAMWDAHWMSGKGPDGVSLMVRTPGGDWNVDGPSSGRGSGWTRSGSIPVVTANPSILIPDKYHGWLRNGILVDC